MTILQELKKAEKAWKDAKKIADLLVKPGINLLQVAEEVEEKIEESAEIAFPINISRNNEAAHYSPKSDCTETFKEGDLVKIDIGTHSNGYIVDAAYTIDLGRLHLELCRASKEAVNNAVKYIQKEKNDAEFGEIGNIIETTIKSYDAYKPIYNLTGHSIEQYKLHAGKSIFNHASNNKNKLGQGLFAIEPFATNGSGLIQNGYFCSIYDYANSITRLSNCRILADEAKKFKLPFSERWIGKDMDPTQKKIAINSLVQSGCFRTHPILVEKQGSYVSQHEKTVYIDEDNKVHVFPNIEF